MSMRALSPILFFFISRRVLSFAPHSQLQECLPAELAEQLRADLAARLDEEVASGGPMRFDVLCVAAKV